MIHYGRLACKSPMRTLAHSTSRQQDGLGAPSAHGVRFATRRDSPIFILMRLDNGERAPGSTEMADEFSRRARFCHEGLELARRGCPAVSTGLVVRTVPKPAQRRRRKLPRCCHGPKPVCGAPQQDPLIAGRSMRPSGLEPPPGLPRTRPSTLRVYQFRHRRSEREYSRGCVADRGPCRRPPAALQCEHMFVTCTYRAGVELPWI